MTRPLSEHESSTGKGQGLVEACRTERFFESALLLHTPSISPALLCLGASLMGLVMASLGNSGQVLSKGECPLSPSLMLFSTQGRTVKLRLRSS